MAFAIHLTRTETGRQRWRRWKYLTILCRALVRAWLGLGPNRIIICMPPRHGKSETASKWFPLWCLDQKPDTRIVLCSYQDTFASTWGGKVRELAEKYASELRFKRRGHGSAEEWYVEGNADPAMRTAGVGGPITGKGADVLIIDDPVKSAAEANSPTIREKTWQWWVATASTRLEPGSICIVIMTRWHHDDLAGRLLAQQKEDEKAEAEVIAENVARTAWNAANDDVEQHKPMLPLPQYDKWLLIKMKAIAENDDEEKANGLGRKVGEALCPERYDETSLEKIRRRDMFAWRSLFQQEPTAEAGDIFERAWFRYFTVTKSSSGHVIGVELSQSGFDDAGNLKVKRFPVDQLRFCQMVDPAASEKSHADFFVDTTFAVTPDNDILVWDMVHDRIPGTRHLSTLKSEYMSQPKGLEPRMLGAGKIPLIGVEPVAFQLTLVQMAKAAGLPVRAIPVDGDKIARAQVPATRMAGEGIFFRAGAVWLEEFEKELLEFPSGAHDDMVDTLSMVAFCMVMGWIGSTGTSAVVSIPDSLMRASPFRGQGRDVVDAQDMDDDMDDEIEYKPSKSAGRGMNIL